MFTNTSPQFACFWNQDVSPMALARLRRQTDFAARNRDRFNRLSPREREILTLIARGATNDEIARQLFRSVHTVRTHRNNIWRQLEITTLIEALWWAQCFDLV
ncbi:response regulator transcription factor [Lewinella sp. 4G2]|uniref:response regulator transcription factor n=1 Tax=Lewinella sp. 4G2 TaxID=1803372 RepID=UPI0007B4C144|nr:helix-turn-helix transcriptional regulator [Lewinella sp. 4G2]OAV43630.1 hypothetical protein A3850_003575 [Lewinella sp. 4G2]